MNFRKDQREATMSGFMADLYQLHKQKMRLPLTRSSCYAMQWVVSAATVTFQLHTRGQNPSFMQSPSLF